MDKRVARFAVILLAALASSACVTYHQPRYGADGVYFDQTHHQPRALVVADPLLYPYWSLDYFYFSRHYHPYSVAVSAFDPWYYPYPGWYYGYRPGAGSSFSLSVGFGTYYPWHGFGYASYRPWRPYAVRYPHYRGHPYQGPSHRVHQIDERLRAIDQRDRSPRIARPTSRPGAPAVRSDAMLRHRLAEDPLPRQAQHQVADVVLLGRVLAGGDGLDHRQVREAAGADPPLRVALALGVVPIAVAVDVV
ncbi:MAG: hypothetical protein ACOC0Q_10305, partial [Wenzhouxiangella sp.]